MNSVHEQIVKIVKNITQNDEDDILESTTAEDIDGWDSLSHIYIITDVEKHFQINFSAAEAYNIKSIGDFISAVESKMPPN